MKPIIIFGAGDIAQVAHFYFTHTILKPLLLIRNSSPIQSFVVSQSSPLKKSKDAILRKNMICLSQSVMQA